MIKAGMTKGELLAALAGLADGDRIYTEDQGSPGHMRPTLAVYVGAGYACMGSTMDFIGRCEQQGAEAAKAKEEARLAEIRAEAAEGGAG